MKKSLEIPVHSILFSNYWKYWCDFEIKALWSAKFLGGCSACVNILKVLCPAGRNSLILFSLFSLVCNLVSCFCELLWAEFLKGVCSRVERQWCFFGCLLCRGFQVYSRSKRSPDTEFGINEVRLCFAIFIYTHTNTCTYACTHACTHVQQYNYLHSQVGSFDFCTSPFHRLTELIS